MACFIVPAAEAVVTKVVEAVEEKREANAEVTRDDDTEAVRIPMSRKLKWLTCMLVGGSVLLMFEHIWHGEVVPYFPFLTAMYSAEATSEMLHEMATVGVTMAVLVTAVWAGICVAADAIVKRTEGEADES
ncbi:MAG: hypothetical protein IJ641_00280 [Lachnospiraceae bacterium]|nr:hypothetical protein [Lachnospiraceae bacterium]